MVDLTQVTVEAREIEVEIVDQTAHGRASATRGRHCHVDPSAQRFVLAPNIGGSESSESRDYRQRSSLLQ